MKNLAYISKKNRRSKEVAEDKTKKVKELMHKPEQIRNIAIAAHIDLA